MNKFLKSAYFKALLVVSAIAVVMLGKEVAGFVLFLNIIGFVLIACKETAVSFLPFMLACTFVVKCYDSFSLFAPLWWAYIFPLCAVAFHFIYYRKEHRFAIGQSFYGIIAVAAAVTLGGIGKISAAEYFSPMALYYVFGLGIGMAGIYLLLKSSFIEYKGYSSRKNFIYDMYIIGLFACFMILHHYAINFRTTLLEHKPANIQWSNNISTILISPPSPACNAGAAFLYEKALCSYFFFTAHICLRGAQRQQGGTHPRHGRDDYLPYSVHRLWQEPRTHDDTLCFCNMLGCGGIFYIVKNLVASV